MKHLTPKETHAYLQAHADALFVDCRTEMEFFYVGHPVGAAHVAWQEAPDWEVNDKFAAEVLREAGAKDRPVVLICRSGNRSVDAGEVLEAAGFADVTNVLYGFEGELDPQHHRNGLNGWRHDGLPWEQM
ncbi:MAG TPA: rhodanese-like domain-containing protein [Burkholderiales bacterium]|nr:rhodanese-like domain-containing protein [Burkholderiales bacterium]